MAISGLVNLPDINITGFFSSTWLYVLIVSVFGFMLLLAVALLIYFKTYNKKVEFYEDIAGAGYQRTMVKRARLLKVGTGGEELLGFMGGATLTAYGRKIGRNRYAFGKMKDGYWLNVVHGDLNERVAQLGFEPTDVDVRMFHVAKERLNRENYLKKSLFDRLAMPVLSIIFLLILIFGIWFIVGKIGDATKAYATTAETNQKVAELNTQNLELLVKLLDTNKVSGGGLVPAT